LTTAQERLFGTKYLSDIALSVTTAQEVDPTKTLIQNTLLAHFNIKDPTEANFSIQNQADMVSTITSITGTLKLFLGAIAAIALIVGGI
jgi:putative ABC transport system permease protein